MNLARRCTGFAFPGIRRYSMGPWEDPQSLKGVAWFDSLFPYQKPIFDPRNYFINRHVLNLKQDFSEYLPKEYPSGSDFKITKIEENLKEGGCYVEFRYKGGTVEEAIDTIQKHLKGNNKRGMFGYEKVYVYQVKGTPWVEDLVSRVPSSRLHVEFHGPDLTVEDLFREFRVYGRIVDISLQPSSSKDTPRYASVQFLKKRSATSARNCIHGEMFGMTRLAIGYEKQNYYWQHAWSWIVNNLRLSIPVILVILAGITFAVFDPWRVFSITNQITGRYNLSAYTKTASKWWNLITSLIEENLGIEHPARQTKEFASRHWSEREAQEDKLSANLKEIPESITLILGPKGSGKTAFINEVLESARNKLYIKCDDLVGKGDYQLLSHLSQQVNFFPTFGFLAQIGGFIDAMITATTGAKANISTTNEGEIQKILECLTLALENVTDLQKKKYQKQLEMGLEIDFEDIEYPVVVIDDFLSKENVREYFIYTKIAEWAAQVEENRIAHVVFVSDNPSAVQALGKVQTKSLELYTLADATPAGAISYAKRKLGPEFKIESIHKWIQDLGGRLHDLELYIQKIQTGSDPKVAYEEMIQRAISELRKMGCLDDPTQKQPWTSIQFWKLVQLLSKKEKVLFDDLIVHPLFASDPTPLLQMERAGIVQLVRDFNRPYYVKPGRPLYTAAFKQMMQDTKLNNYMSMLSAKWLYKQYTQKILDLESELNSLPNDGWFYWTGTNSRKRWIKQTIGIYHEKAKTFFDMEDRLKAKLKLAE